VWGWSSVATWGCVIVGALLMIAFVLWEMRTPNPLLRLQIFRDRGFSTETAVLGLMSVVFVPFFFFASVYAQVSLGDSASEAGVYLLVLTPVPPIPGGSSAEGANPLTVAFAVTSFGWTRSAWVACCAHWITPNALGVKQPAVPANH